MSTDDYQFSKTNDERRASLIYSTSVGKTGLFTPADYLSPKSFNHMLDAFEEQFPESSSPDAGGEGEDGADSDLEFTSQISEGINISTSRNNTNLQQPLLNQNREGYGSLADNISINTTNRFRRKRHDSLIQEERDLLIDNNLLLPKISPHSSLIANNLHELSIHNNSISQNVDQIYHEDNDDDGGILNDTDDVISVWRSAIDDGKEINTTYKREFQVILYNAFPLYFYFFLQYSLSVASIFSVSHLGTKELGAVTLGSMTANITGIAIIQGLCTCLDTLCAQAYGAKNYKLVGIFFQRCAAITIIFFIPIMYCWWSWSELVLSYMIPEQDLCVLAARYLRISALGIPGFILFECGKRFLQCQGIFHASTIVLFICAPTNAVLNYLLVWDKHIGIGYLGAPLAVSISYWLMAIGLLFYTLTTNNEKNPLKCYPGLIHYSQIFKNWKHMFALAIPGIVMVEAEFLGFEILTIFAAHLGETQLASQAIVSTVAALAYQIPFSISIATSTRVANFIGASLYKPCITTCKTSLLLSFICSTTNMLVITTSRFQFARLFSNEEKVVELVANTLPLLAFMQLFDAFNATTAGCLRGQGRQKIGGYINVFAFYFVGIPISYLLAFHFNFDLQGLWIGIICALMIMSLFQGIAVFNVDWIKLINIARDRNSEIDSL
ncbi:hypothetical protein TBLA_0A10400 [Henningerozyma blattae CBS 6284]|uniref:Ethionine resistance-conferring protein 1 n=1 Tax=Henningerozyma blattae (strain ATCC 34711 / CBS 6284 / DSM 70876 / NBRC 10599 / NRRL Y-10934 / UCD 77-7) TaxID=1071380 RepID=I2GXG6_HENB6|nr:hypothetical protein TBLA_0A10400 [Tetrapisispora blattae CBS 6284]CCH58818.1 hypothetical protein TBLA_0A10400 [Tetrapisispora blattae CBS 6284]